MRDITQYTPRNTRTPRKGRFFDIMNIMTFPDEKKKVLYGAGAAVLVVAVFFIVWAITSSSGQSEAEWRAQEETNVAAIIQGGNFEACGRVAYTNENGIDYRGVCVNNVALKKAQETLDISWCDKLDDRSVSRDECRKSVIYQKLARERKIETCELFKGDEERVICRDIYWQEEAAHANDPRLCEKVSGGTEEKAACRDEVSLRRLAAGEHIQCSSFSSGLVSDCEAFSAARDTSDMQKRADLCRTISNPRLQAQCIPQS